MKLVLCEGRWARVRSANGDAKRESRTLDSRPAGWEERRPVSAQANDSAMVTLDG